MIIPPGKTEQEVLDAIERAVNLLATTFVFGYYDIEDIKQEGRLEGIKLMNDEKYDPSRPLENFIYRHIQNRFINLHRNKVRRADAPCRPCHLGTPCIPGGCKKYAAWKARNSAKANLMRPVEMDDVHEDRYLQLTPAEDVDTAAMMKKIDEHLSVELRLWWNQIRDGVKVPKPRRIQVEDAVREILGMSSEQVEES